MTQERPNNPYSKEKSERIETRLSCEQKSLIQRAAYLSGRTLTDFVISSSQDAAKKIIQEYEVINLVKQDAIRFAETLLNPPKPNAALKKAAKRYKEFKKDKR